MMNELRKKINNKKWLIVICPALIVSICLAFYGQYDFIFIGTVGFIFFWASAILLFIYFASIILFSITKSNKLFQMRKYSLILFTACCILFISFPISVKLIDYDAAQTKKYCESLISRIESYKSKYGKYPATIDSIISEKGNLPPILRDYNFYKSIGDGTSYEFIVPLIGPNVSWEIYDTTNKNWEKLVSSGSNGVAH